MSIELNGDFYKTNLLVEQHFHGAFGVDFSVCESDEILFLARQILKHGIGGFYPTLVTDSVENIKRQVKRIKEAATRQTDDMAQILGIHLEGIFINPERKGIHDEALFLKPTIENYRLFEDDFIKIITLAPELDEGGVLRKYLSDKGVKVQAGHCSDADLSHCSGVTHLFNAMKGISHREASTSLSALINDDIYTEIIADGIHLSDDILNLVFKSKPEDKMILVSDSLPLASSDLTEMNFAGQKIFYDGKKATSAQGTIAGSTMVLDGIIKRLSFKNPDAFEKYVKMASDNLFNYHDIEIKGCAFWNSDFEIVAVEKSGAVLYKNV